MLYWHRVYNKHDAKNTFCLPIQKIKYEVFTSSGSILLNNSVILLSNNIFKTNEQFYLHNNLNIAKTIVNYKKCTVNLYDKVYPLINSSPDKNQAFYFQNTPESDRESNHILIKTKNWFWIVPIRSLISHFNQEKCFKLKLLLNKFKNLQYKEGDHLTFTNTIKHVLNTTHNPPIYSKQYPLVTMHEIEVENQVQEMLNQGLISQIEAKVDS